ncbi:protein serine/threonine phosphatase 2C [Aspergillus steynii IBT 23096]|uniref:Protein serine/threonine phosphatase 2C n=1 Tax=Aspergillus steynii IBT 23096 TaxID=1392250 RepID=A0A2I2GRG4_9EURO|nr:protein serine/threonine phosphatase 2C [Aspergillus steynii IBT 23096]PLB55444.1 protein serine/threonine phosphatase 2C [Aspergillus steynii IBT 23096]
MPSFRILDMAGQTAQGDRKHQEDRYTCIMPDEFSPPQGAQIAYFAVYDGHGSDEVSEFARQSLHHRIADREEFRAGQFDKAIVSGLKDIDDELYERFRGGSDESAMCGCTVSLCLVDLTGGSLLVANLGDSPVILGTKDGDGYRVQRLSQLHSPTNDDERDRIFYAGGQLNDVSGEERLGAVNMTRALGDLQLKRPLNEATVDKGLEIVAGTSPSKDTEDDFMSRIPSMRVRRLSRSSGKQILILASDGVTNALDDERLVKLVGAMEKEGHAARDISRATIDLVGKEKNSDNCTCIVVVLGYEE